MDKFLTFMRKEHFVEELDCMHEIKKKKKDIA